MHCKSLARLCVLTSSLLLACQVLVSGETPDASIGPFEGHADIGTVLHPGSATYDAAKKTFTVSASGENVWFTTDAFHFVWRKVSGDVAVGADISFLGAGGNEHRKAVVMVRQSFNPGSAYADVALHGNGLTSLQYRDAEGANTHEIQANISAPTRIRIEKRGQYAYMWLGEGGESFTWLGAPFASPWKDPSTLGSESAPTTKT